MTHQCRGSYYSLSITALLMNNNNEYLMVTGPIHWIILRAFVEIAKTTKDTERTSMEECSVLVENHNVMPSKMRRNNWCTKRHHRLKSSEYHRPKLEYRRTPLSFGRKRKGKLVLLTVHTDCHNSTMDKDERKFRMYRSEGGKDALILHFYTNSTKIEPLCEKD